MVQWLRICPPRLGTQGQSLVQEDLTCLRITTEAHTSRACEPQLWGPSQASLFVGLLSTVKPRSLLLLAHCSRGGLSLGVPGRCSPQLLPPRTPLGSDGPQPYSHCSGIILIKHLFFKLVEITAFDQNIHDLCFLSQLCSTQNIFKRRAKSVWTV